MGLICLPQGTVDKFKAAFSSGKLNPDEMMAESTSSADRRAMIETIAGKDQSHDINSFIESKLLLKDQKAGLLNAIKKMTGLAGKDQATVEAAARLKVERMTEYMNPAQKTKFLEDHAQTVIDTKYKLKTSPEQVKEVQNYLNITQANDAKLTDSLKRAGIDRTATDWKHTPATQDAALQASASKTALNMYVNELKNEGTNLTLKQRLNPRNYAKNVSDLLSTTKSLVYALNPHAPFKHGLPALFEGDAKTAFLNPDWFKNWARQYKDAFNTVVHNVNTEAVTATEIGARPNAINGLYDTWNKSLLKQNEEFKATGVGKIPLGIGRLWRGSKAMFDGFNMNMRADMIDHYINIVQRMGLDPKDPQIAKEWGHLAIIQTGGESALHGPEEYVSKLLSSERLIKSQVDILTRPLNLWSGDSLPVRVKAAKSLVKMSVGLGVLALTTKAIANATGNKFSVGTNNDATGLGKIKIGPVSVDTTGGLGSYTTFLTREFSGQSTSASGNVSQLNTGKFGSQTKLSVAESFLQGRLSPIMGMVASYLAGQDFSGNKPTLSSSLKSTFTPIPLQNQSAASKAGLTTEQKIALFLAETIGGALISVTPPSTKTPSLAAQAAAITKAKETPAQKAKKAATAAKTQATRIKNEQKIVNSAKK